jgi:hypothetical protein
MNAESIVSKVWSFCTTLRKVRGLVEEWAEPNQEELLTMWNTKDFHKIKPLV